MDGREGRRWGEEEKEERVLEGEEDGEGRQGLWWDFHTCVSVILQRGHCPGAGCPGSETRQQSDRRWGSGRETPTK